MTDEVLPTPQNKPERDSGIVRFFQKVNKFFKEPPAQSALKLSGRIHEMEAAANKASIDLLQFKQEIDNKIDPYLYSLVCNAVDPIIKEISHIQKVREHLSSPSQQVKIFHRLVLWIEKAKKWTELLPHLQANEVVQKVIVAHILGEFQALVDRDVKIIEDYLYHALSDLEKESQFDELHREELLSRLQPLLKNFSELKFDSKVITIRSLASWRHTADQSREACFVQSLQLIDSFVDMVTPAAAFEGNKESKHVTEILLKLAILEDQIIKLSMQLESLENSDEKNIKTCLTIIEQLAVDANEMNCDLRLPHEHADRVQQAIEALESMRNDLDSYF